MSNRLSFVLGLLICSPLSAQQGGQLTFLNHNRPVLDAHNCYPYEGRFSNRIERALGAGLPVAIEQDLAWYVDPTSGKGRVVVSHTPKTDGTEPTLEQYFFDRVKPVVEKALKDKDKTGWPVIVLHFDFKDTQAPLLHAVWDLLGRHEAWITTAQKVADPNQLASFDAKPLLVLTEESDLQEEVFFNQVAVGSKLRVFGSVHSAAISAQDTKERNRLLATMPVEQLLTARATNYRRWWNNSWYVVEEGGQPEAGEWTDQEAERLRALVNRAHAQGLWIRFYTLDGFGAQSDAGGWGQAYNFGSPAAVRLRWKAALDAGVNLIASDQYEDLAAFMGATGYR